MSEYEFSFIVEGFDVEDGSANDQLVEQFDYARASESAGLTTVLFNVEAASANDALHHTLNRFTSVFPTARVVRLHRDLVSIADIASRTGRSGESVRLYVTGKRGPGGFPTPVSVLHGGTRVWEWATVVEWFRTQMNELLDEPEMIDTEHAALFDAHLATQRPGLRRDDKELVTSIADAWNHVVVAYRRHVAQGEPVRTNVHSWKLTHPLVGTATESSWDAAMVAAFGLYDTVRAPEAEYQMVTGSYRKVVVHES